MKAKTPKGSKQVAVLFTPAQVRTMVGLVNDALNKGALPDGARPYVTGDKAAQMRALVGCWSKVSAAQLRLLVGRRTAK